MKLYIIAAIVLLAFGSGIIVWIRSDAAKDALDKVERKNNEIGNTSDNARSQFDTCPDGMWDYGASRCKVTPQGNGN